MSETTPPPPKKMVRRSIAIALGTICILFIAVIAYFSVTGISTQNSYNNLQNITNLVDSTGWVNNQTVRQSAGAYTHWVESAEYAGYVSVNISSSTTTPIYVELSYTYGGLKYDSQVNVGTKGTAYFPVLPCSNIWLEVGNKNSVGGTIETVTVTYYY